MENVTIPGWVWGLASFVFFTWLLFLTRMAFNGEKKQSVSEADDQRIFADISRIERKLDDTKEHIDGSLDKFENKFEKFETRMDKMLERTIDLLKLAAKP